MLGVTVGGAGASAMVGDDGPVSVYRVDQRTGTTDWPTNASGLTYGSAAHAKTPADEPDLIAAIATNGKEGYILRTDLESDSPRSPREALEHQAKMAGVDVRIPVYEVDGKTQIGEFVIEGG